MPPEMSVTGGIGVHDLSGVSMTFASAANPEVYHFSRKEGSVRPLGVTGFPLGLPLIPKGTELFNSIDVDLSPGDVVVFASDGVENAQDRQENHGNRREASADEIRDEIVASVTRFIGDAPQVDDLTVVVLKALTDA